MPLHVGLLLDAGGELLDTRRAVAVLGDQVEVRRHGRQQHDRHDIEGAHDKVQRPPEAGGNPRRRLLAKVRKRAPRPTAIPDSPKHSSTQVT